MVTIHLNQTTTSTPEFVAGLTGFGPGRSKIFGRSADGYLKVHEQGTGQADVTEGSGGIWERLHYDWSDPNRVEQMSSSGLVPWNRPATVVPGPSAAGDHPSCRADIAHDDRHGTSNSLRPIAERLSRTRAGEDQSPRRLLHADAWRLQKYN